MCPVLSWLCSDVSSHWFVWLAFPFACLLSCVAVFCFIFMICFPKYVPVPWGVCVSHSLFLHSLCLVDKMLDAHFLVMMMMMTMTMTMMMEKQLVMPFLYFFTFPPHPLPQWNCSRAPGCCSPRSSLSLSNTGHCWLLLPYSQICFPWLLWLGFPGLSAILLDFQIQWPLGHIHLKGSLLQSW